MSEMACGFEPHHRQSETCVTAQVFLYVSDDIQMIYCRDWKAYLSRRYLAESVSDAIVQRAKDISELP